LGDKSRPISIFHPRINKPRFYPLLRIFTEIILLRYRLTMRGRLRIGRGFICNQRLRISGPGKVVIGDWVNAWAHQEPTMLITADKEAKIIIGNNVRLNGPTLIASRQIEIGDLCILGSAVVFDTDFHSVHKDRSTNRDAPVRKSPIKIGKNVWLAGQCAVLPGVHIGDDSVVGFRAVVTKDVPAGVIVAGNPARVVREIGEESRHS